MSELKHYPLTITQEFLAFFASAFPIEALTEISQIRFTSEIDENRLLEAIRISVKRQYYTGIRIHKLEDGKFTQYHYEGKPEPIETVDLPECSEEELNELFRSWAQAAFPGVFTDIQLYRFKLLRYPNGDKGLFFCFQHFIIDGYSAVTLLQYIANVYEALLNGTELPKPAPEPWKLLDMEKNYYDKRFKKDLQACLKKFETEPHFTSVGGTGSPEFIEGKRYGKMRDFTQLAGATIHHSLPRDLVTRMTEKASELNVSLCCFYTLVAYCYLARKSETDDVTIELLNNARGTLYEKQCGFQTVSNMIFRTVLSDEISFTDGLSAISDEQNELLRHNRISSDHIQAALNERFQPPEGSCYQTFSLSYFQPVLLDQGSVEFKASFVNNGWAPQPLLAQIMPEDGKGGMAACYIYSVGYTTPESVEAFHSFMLRFLENGLNAPDQSLRELIDKSL